MDMTKYLIADHTTTPCLNIGKFLEEIVLKIDAVVRRFSLGSEILHKNFPTANRRRNTHTDFSTLLSLSTHHILHTRRENPAYIYIVVQEKISAHIFL